MYACPLFADRCLGSTGWACTLMHAQHVLLRPSPLSRATSWRACYKSCREKLFVCVFACVMWRVHDKMRWRICYDICRVYYKCWRVYCKMRWRLWYEMCRVHDKNRSGLGCLRCVIRGLDGTRAFISPETVHKRVLGCAHTSGSSQSTDQSALEHRNRCCVRPTSG